MWHFIYNSTVVQESVITINPIKKFTFPRDWTHFWWKVHFSTGLNSFSMRSSLSLGLNSFPMKSSLFPWIEIIPREKLIFPQNWNHSRGKVHFFLGMKSIPGKSMNWSTNYFSSWSLIKCHFFIRNAVSHWSRTMDLQAC